MTVTARTRAQPRMEMGAIPIFKPTNGTSIARAQRAPNASRQKAKVLPIANGFPNIVPEYLPSINHTAQTITVLTKAKAVICIAL